MLVYGLGVAGAGGQSPLSLPLLSLGALFLILMVFRTVPRGAASFWLGWLFGAGYFSATLFWIVEPFLVDASQTGWMAPFALVLMSGGMALFWGAGFWMAGQLPSPRARPVLLIATLGLAELARAYALTGFPWALVGYIWYATPIMQLSAYFGPHGLGALTLVIVTLPLVVPRVVVGLTLSAAIAAAAWIVGSQRENLPASVRENPVTVRLVQPNAAQDQKWDPRYSPVFFQRQLDLSAAKNGSYPDLVIWPEAAVTFWLGDDPARQRAIAQSAGPARVIFGVRRHGDTRYYNSLAFLDREGSATHVYDKRHLVPFGEYIPLGWLLSRFGIHGLAASEGGGFSSGLNTNLLDLGALGKVQPLICYEAIFPALLHRSGERPDWLLQITNDAWYGQMAGPQQHLAIAAFRAVEQGLPLVRVANTGISAVIDARGHTVASLGLGEAGYLDASVPGTLRATLYSRTGDIPVPIFYLIGIFMIF
ncbi:MAG: apolipoprotein N-acyltransferase, partial [Paracoccaceae bacterium]